MNIKCDCGGLMKPVVLDRFDFTEMAGIASFLQGAPGLRCASCGNETVPGEVVNFALREIGRSLARMPQLLPASGARFLRRYMRLSQQELADRMGVNRVTVAKWEGSELISPQHDFILRTVFTSHAMLEQKPRPEQYVEWAKAIEGVRCDASAPAPFVIERFLQTSRAASPRAGRTRG